jgi:hypothetical protein
VQIITGCSWTVSGVDIYTLYSYYLISGMPITYLIDQEKKRIYSRVTGAVSFIDLREHMRSEFGRTASAFPELFDCTEAIADDLNADDMRMLVKERSQIAQVQTAAPVAIVAPTDELFDLFKIFNSLSSNIRPIGVFRDTCQAEKWLDQFSSTSGSSG